MKISMSRLQNNVYHQIVAQNFLRNISLDGTHNDTALRIFKEKGFEFNFRHHDLSLPVPHSSSIAPESEEPINRPAGQNSVEDNVVSPIRAINSDSGHRRQRFSPHRTSLDVGEALAVKRVQKGQSADNEQLKTRRSKYGSFRERLGSGDFESAHRRRKQQGRRILESFGEGGFLEKLRLPFAQYHRRHETSRPVALATMQSDPSTSRTVKWGTLPAVASEESVATRASILSTKGGELVVVDGNFSDPRAKGARLCFCHKQLPVLICSILPLKHLGTAALLRKMDTACDSKSISSSEDAGLKPFNLKTEEISYSPMLVPSRSEISMLQYSMYADSPRSFGVSGNSSISSTYDPNEQKPGESTASNFLSVEIGGQQLLHKHDISNESDTTANRSLLQLDFRQLDDPAFGAGKHKTILTFTSYMTSVIDYVNRDEMKREINDKFRKKFPDIRLTYSKYQSLKRDMKSLALAVNLDLLTLAQAYCYFDTIVLKALISKTNRKLVASACLLLAAKMNDVKGADLKLLIHKLEERFRVNRKEVVQYELPVAVALEFCLHIPVDELSAQYQKLLWST